MAIISCDVLPSQSDRFLQSLSWLTSGSNIDLLLFWYKHNRPVAQYTMNLSMFVDDLFYEIAVSDTYNNENNINGKK